MIIEQVKVSESVKFFTEGFKQRWGMVDYFDRNKPCVFLGVYDMMDVNAINSHSGYKIIFMTGAVRDCFYRINPNKVIIKTHKLLNINGYQQKEVRIPIKDYSMFKPNPLGEKIYWYVGREGIEWQRQYGIDLYDRIASRCKCDIILGMHGHSIEYIKENYYDKCFVNLNLTLKGGGGHTTGYELGYMGRKSIVKNLNIKSNHFLYYETFDDIIDLIEKERKKIGTVQPSLMDGFFYENDDWKQLNFWL